MVNALGAWRGLFRNPRDVVCQFPRRVACLVHDDVRAGRRIEAQGAECVHVAPIVELNLNDRGRAPIAGFLDVHHSRLADLHVKGAIGPLDLPYQKERENRHDARLRLRPGG